MSDERLQILKMVQEGKVSAEEAAKLLDAVEQPAGKGKESGPRARHVRFEYTEGSKRSSFSVGVGLVNWALRILPASFTVDVNGAAQKINRQQILDAIEGGVTGKIFEWEDGKDRLEIWLDA
jgi:hypothetical protein